MEKSETIRITKNGRCLASGLYIHINASDFKIEDLKDGDWYWDVDWGMFTWNGEAFI